MPRATSCQGCRDTSSSASGTRAASPAHYRSTGARCGWTPCKPSTLSLSMETTLNPSVLHSFSEDHLRRERFPSRQRAVRNDYRTGAPLDSRYEPCRPAAPEVADADEPLEFVGVGSRRPLYKEQPVRVACTRVLGLNPAERASGADHRRESDPRLRRLVSGAWGGAPSALRTRSAGVRKASLRIGKDLGCQPELTQAAGHIGASGLTEPKRARELEYGDGPGRHAQPNLAPERRLARAAQRSVLGKSSPRPVVT